MSTRRTILLGALLIAAAACTQLRASEAPTSTTPVAIPTGAVSPRGDRQLGFDLNEASDGDFDRAFQLARDAGMERVAFSPSWSMIETGPEEYDSAWLDIAAAYYPAREVTIDLTIMVINANRKEFPADLMERTFDDPLVIDRFERLLEFVFAHLPVSTLGSLNIGSELDISFGVDRESWGEFTTFYAAIVDYVHARQPGLRIATEQTFKGITGPARDLVAALNTHSDLIGVSYYPLDEEGNVQDPAVVHQDMEALVSLYPGQTIYFYQFGYPSSTFLNSSGEKQSRFMVEAFQAWDAHADQVKLIDFTWLHDMPPADVQAIGEYYGIADRKFTEYIASLGLRTYEGEDKMAFRTLVAEAAARGW